VVVVAARLTDKQKKKIIADYVQLGSYNAAAKANGVADSTVKRIVLSDPEMQRKAEQKKEQNTQDMLAFMDSRKDVAQNVIDQYLKALADPEKLEEATLSQIATALGIVVDKFMKTAGGNGDGNLPDLIKGLKEQ